MPASPLRKTIAKLDLLSLRLFLTICEESSISRTAARERITASAVTKRMQDLEYLFGVKLLYRTPGNTSPTPVGEALAARARQLFQVVEDLRAELSEYADGARGHLRISAAPSALAGFLAADLREFALAHPNIELDIREQLSVEVVHAVSTGTADLGFYATPPVISADVASYLYKRDELVVVMPRDHPFASKAELAFADLLSMDLIGVNDSSSVMSQLRRAAADLNKQLRVRHYVQSNEIAREMVGAGFGVTVLPQGIAGFARTGATVSARLTDPWARRELRVCVRDDGSLPVQARTMLRFLLGNEFPR